MEKSLNNDSQILNILKQAKAGTPVAELCGEHGMSSAAFYKWRAKNMVAWMLNVWHHRSEWRAAKFPTHVH